MSDTKRAKALAFLFAQVRLGNADAQVRFSRFKARFPEARGLMVAQTLLDVGRSLQVFYYGDKQYLSKAVTQAMFGAETAFGKGDYDRAEHLTRVVVAIVERDAKNFAADPEKWVQKWNAVR
jgi:hypothetical protein